MARAPLRVALVGAGRIAGAFASPGDPAVTHAAAIFALPDLTLEAIVEPDTARRIAFASRWNIPIQKENVGDLEAGYDLIAVAVPDSFHVSTATAIMERGPPRLLLVEKPLCLTDEQLQQLGSHLTASAGVPLAVNHSRRYDPGHIAVQGMLSREDLGPLIDIRWVYYGGWLHNGVHLVDTLRMLLDDTLDLRSARHGYPGIGDDDCIEGEFRPRRNPHVRICVESFPESAFQLFEAEIRCRDGRIRLLDFGTKILVDRVQTNATGERELKITSPLVRDGKPPMMALYESAVQFLRDGDRTIIDRSGYATAAETMRILFEARKLS